MAAENLDKEEKSEDGVNDTSIGHNDKEDVAEGEIEEETEKEVDILDNDGDSIGSEDTVKADDDSNVDTTEDENTDNDLIQPEGGHHTDDEKTSTPSLNPAEMEDKTGEEAEEEEPSFNEKTDIVCGSLGHKHVEQNLDQPQSLSQGYKDNVTGHNEVDREQREDSVHCLHTDETDLEVGGFAFGFSNEEHIYEEAGFDSEGENFVTIDRKTIVTRSRSYSGKISGYVPETVPEETGTEYQTHDYCTVALDKNNEPLSHSQPPGVKSLIPSMKSQRFLFYSRSAEGPELTLTSPTEINHSRKDDIRMKRKDDTLSLPCVITSSGSFSQRSLQSSSGVSTPTSLVDIPPPFELAYITKRPVTKSSPSLLIQNEPSEIPKKKSSFKRFLALKFRKKTDSKGFSDGSVRSSRSSSESSHHGTVRVIELDRRSTGSSPQLQNRIVNPQQRPLELPPPFVLHLQRKKGDPKTYGRGVSRVESFEERSRRSAMPLPLTKPRSISFPSADTSDYENIPAMSSDYENIQIPSRPTRSHTVTEFFEDPNRTTVACNENDGYVDMNSFPGIESITQTSKEDTERYTVFIHLPLFSLAVHQIDGRSRAFYVAKELDFRSAVTEAAVGEEGEPVLEEQRLGEILSVLPQVYTLHSSILTELEERISQWEESQRVVDVILSRRADFGVFDTFISQYDRSMFLLEESCRENPAFANVVKTFETNMLFSCFFFVLFLCAFWQMFVKEGTLMKVSRKSRQPRHLFLMNDIMLYTYPQQDGKYRLKNTLSLSGMKVSKPVLDHVLNCLKIEVSDITITLSAREKLWMALGEAAPVLVPVSHAMMCMNCTSDFSLTLRRHHCNACGKVVCRSCSRNRYPLKYLKDRVAKVCDHCHAELRKRGESHVSGACGNSSPRTHRASRPLSAVFQSLQPPSLWKSRKSASHLNQDKVASESLPLQCFTVKLTERPEGEESNVFHLYHKKTLHYTFRADDPHTARRYMIVLYDSVQQL
uniref:FYVE, RhoGEF and PH domain containing 5 n=1 Tax=Cyclopterus lumpus TaxID=8103 RepID=A0A8C2XK59_CYCLU